jgi:hypothetical protein
MSWDTAAADGLVRLHNMKPTMQALGLQESRDTIRCTLNGALEEQMSGSALLEMPDSFFHKVSGARGLLHIFNAL